MFCIYSLSVNTAICLRTTGAGKGGFYQVEVTGKEFKG